MATTSTSAAPAAAAAATTKCLVVQNDTMSGATVVATVYFSDDTVRTRTLGTADRHVWCNPVSAATVYSVTVSNAPGTRLPFLPHTFSLGGAGGGGGTDASNASANYMVHVTDVDATLNETRSVSAAYQANGAGSASQSAPYSVGAAYMPMAPLVAAIPTLAEPALLSAPVFYRVSTSGALYGTTSGTADDEPAWPHEPGYKCTLTGVAQDGAFGMTCEPQTVDDEAPGSPRSGHAFCAWDKSVYAAGTGQTSGGSLRCSFL